jgi:hypothetical protein
LIAAPTPPLVRLSLGVTGHRETNATFTANRERVEAALGEVFSHIAAFIAAEADSLGPTAPVRLHNLLAHGVDQLTAAMAVRRGWELVAPLPFGRQLNLAINAHPVTKADATALLRGERPADPEVAARAEAVGQWYGAARLFELAEHDETTTRLFLETLAVPNELARAQAFAAQCSERVALAARVMIEQSDILVAVWDGESRSHVGGTGHTIAAALELGTPVVCIDPARAGAWRILSAPESLTNRGNVGQDRNSMLASLVRTALRPIEDDALHIGAQALGNEAWYPRSSRIWTGYRRIEALFGGDGRPFRSLVQRYETPEQIGTGSGAQLLTTARSMAVGDPDFTNRIEAEVLRRFAWADGISSRLSDAYRGSMIANFMLSILAVAAGMAYQPLGRENDKWLFALAELLLLCSILLIIRLGGKWRWHKRWFETRRVAEYFRHAPILQLLGVARPTGRWPKGSETSWPEYYGRHGLRAPGLPRVAITATYLRQALEQLLDDHVVRQRDYHLGKAKRLTTVHRRLDRLSGRLFQLAVLTVAGYLALAAAAAAGLAPHGWPHTASKLFTFLGVMLPALGASIAGMRYFGDFERFAAISEITAEKLEGVHQRIRLLLDAPDHLLDYAGVSDLAHTVDAIVVDEIENWQAVFGGKHITVPV